MSMYVILMYAFRNANTHHDLKTVSKAKIGGKQKKKINHIYYYLLSSYFLLQFQQFVKENLTGKSRILTQAIESVKTNTNWMDLNYETIVEWLRNATRS